MGKRVAIVQSSYIPWKGYFDLIGLADEFILLDDAQYTRRDWRNRNRIPTANGPIWLTIPVEAKGRYHQRIDETRIRDPGWAERHWRTLSETYARAEGFGEIREPLAEAYRAVAGEPLLTVVNERLLRALCALLGITTPIRRSMDYLEDAGRRTERLVALCVAAGATEYLSGPAARAYLDEVAFAAEGVAVRWMDYAGYPDYPQGGPGPFDHHVSVVDLLASVGPAAARGHLQCAARVPA